MMAIIGQRLRLAGGGGWGTPGVAVSMLNPPPFDSESGDQDAPSAQSKWAAE
jgi:hypothetical protein